MTRLERRHHGPGDDRAVEEERARHLVAIARRGVQPAAAELRELLMVAAEPSGPARKVALDVIGAVCRGDVSVAHQLARSSLGLAREPWIARHVAKALGRIGVADDRVSSAMRVAQRGHGRHVMGKRAARAALVALGRPDLVVAEFPWVRSARDHVRLVPAIERLSREAARGPSFGAAAARATGGVPIELGIDGPLVLMRDASVIRLDVQSGAVQGVSGALRDSALMRAAERHMDLLALWPDRPAGAGACAACAGAGTNQDASPCTSCRGTGWGIGVD